MGTQAEQLPVIPGIHNPETIGFAADASNNVYENDLCAMNNFMSKRGFSLGSSAPDVYGRGLRARMYVRNQPSAVDMVFVYRGVVLSEQGNVVALLKQIVRAATHGMKTGGDNHMGGASGSGISGRMHDHPAMVQQALSWTEDVVGWACRNLQLEQEREERQTESSHSGSNGNNNGLDSKRIRVLLTGHSMGGLIAKLALIRLVQMNTVGWPTDGAVSHRLGAVGCIAFDAPGLLEQELLTAQRLGYGASYWEGVLSEYVFYPNPVNMYGAHTLGAVHFLEHELEATPEWVELCQTVRRAATNPLATLAPKLNPKWVFAASIATSLLTDNKVILCSDHAKRHAKLACEMEAIGLHSIAGRLRWLTDASALRRVTRRVTGWPSLGSGEAGIGAALDKICSDGYHGVELSEFQPTAMAPLRGSGVHISYPSAW